MQSPFSELQQDLATLERPGKAHPESTYVRITAVDIYGLGYPRSRLSETGGKIPTPDKWLGLVALVLVLCVPVVP